MEQVAKLMEEGAPINWSTIDGWTVLHKACINDRTEVLKVLLRYSPDVNKPKNDGYTALHMACQYGYVECVQLLLSSGQCELG